MHGKHPLWTLRSKEEAAEFWQEEFGDKASDNGSGLSGQGEPNTQQDPQGKPPIT